MRQDHSENWAQAAQQLQQAWMDAWKPLLGNMPASVPSAMPANPMAAWPAMQDFPAFPGLTEMRALIPPQKFEALQKQYVEDCLALMQGKPAAPADRRFTGEAWKGNPYASMAAASYLLNARFLMEMADAVEGDPKMRARIRFSVEQWVAASAPSNFLAFNADALKKAVETQGESLTKGMQNLMHDVAQGHVSMTDESQFEVGRNVATSEGAVVYENELFQLIEYKPTTAQVYERPFLIVPPCINKFYILDLQPENSFVGHAVAQGHRTFVVSWRNPDESLAHKTWDDYIDGAVIRAIQVVREISGQDKAGGQVNALGFCVGGTMLGTALAVLAARGEKPVHSATFLTTFLDFTDTGILDVFIDEAMVKLREQQYAQGGLMAGRDLASTFSFLRPNDLVWNYVVGNYLKGETPPPFDLLYWNSDSTNLPGPFYAWYLRNTYLENNLIKPGHAKVCGVPVDLGKVDIPVYIYGSREDHIVPIGGAYASTQALPGKKRFVMGASGHIAGVINPPAKKKRSHWIRKDGKLPATFDAWMSGADEHVGSWWPDWAAWLKGQAGKVMPAPKRYGKGTTYKAMEPAPGHYVKAKA